MALARAGKRTTYHQLAAEVGVDLSQAKSRDGLAAILRAISTAERREERPMLSALVVLQGRGRPGRGFFELARELGAWDGRDAASFHDQEMARVWAEWRSRD